MSERKYTDEEIVKALECCSGIGDAKCVDCPYHDAERCAEASATDAIDLINRLKAEIERLNIELDAMQYELDLLKQEKSVVVAEAIREFAERFKETSNGIVALRDGVEIYETKLYQIRATSFDNLVAEMTEGE